MSKSIEALKEIIRYCSEEIYDINEITYENPLEEECNLIKQDLEAYEQLKQDHDKTLINNGELCVKVCKLEKALDKACEHLDYVCPITLNFIDDLERENKCWKKYFLNLADVEVLEND